MPKEFIFISGKIVASEDATIKVSDRGFLLGDGIFETIRAFNGIPLLFDKHWKRLRLSADFFRLPIPISKAELYEIVEELLEKNELNFGHASLRITLSGGSAPRGLLVKAPINPTFIITAFPLVPHDNSPLRVCVSPYPKNAQSPTVKHKTINYLENIVSKRFADENGFDDALLLNTDGKITELTIANVFFIKNNCVYTPPIQDGVLPGVTRETIIEECRSKGLQIEETSLGLQDLISMDEMFLTNALMHIRRVSQVDGWFKAKSASPSTLFDEISNTLQLVVEKSELKSQKHLQM